MELAPEEPNVTLREDEWGDPIVVLAFPYDAHIVAAVREIPHRKFDWDKREWFAPADPWNALHVQGVLERFPDLRTSTEVDAWLKGVEARWVARVRTIRHDSRGWWVLDTRSG